MRQTYVRPNAEYINMSSFEEVLFGSGYNTAYCVPSLGPHGEPKSMGYYNLDVDAFLADNPDGMTDEIADTYCWLDSYCINICATNGTATCSIITSEWYLVDCNDAIGWDTPGSPKYCGCGTTTV